MPGDVITLSSDDEDETTDLLSQKADRRSACGPLSQVPVSGPKSKPQVQKDAAPLIPTATSSVPDKGAVNKVRRDPSDSLPAVRVKQIMSAERIVTASATGQAASTERPANHKRKSASRAPLSQPQSIPKRGLFPRAGWWRSYSLSSDVRCDSRSAGHTSATD